MIKFEEFQKIELKVGVIEKAEKIEGTEKLVKLEVDTGEKRTMVAGIAHQYSPKELVGKKIIVVTNLEPRKIKGIESQGMLLAALDEEIISIITPDKEVRPGSKVA